MDFIYLPHFGGTQIQSSNISTHLHMQRDNIYRDTDALVRNAAGGPTATVVVFENVLH